MDYDAPTLAVTDYPDSNLGDLEKVSGEDATQVYDVESEEVEGMDESDGKLSEGAETQVFDDHSAISGEIKGKRKIKGRKAKEPFTVCSDEVATLSYDVEEEEETVREKKPKKGKQKPQPGKGKEIVLHIGMTSDKTSSLDIDEEVQVPRELPGRRDQQKEKDESGGEGESVCQNAEIKREYEDRTSAVFGRVYTKRGKQAALSTTKSPTVKAGETNVGILSCD